MKRAALGFIAKFKKLAKHQSKSESTSNSQDFQLTH